MISHGQLECLRMGNWNVTLLNGKEQELVWEAEQYHLDIAGVSSTKCRDSDTVELNEGWNVFHSGVDVAMSAGVGIFVGRYFCKPLAWPTVSLVESHSEEGFVSLNLGYRSSYFFLLYFAGVRTKRYAPNVSHMK